MSNWMLSTAFKKDVLSPDWYMTLEEQLVIARLKTSFGDAPSLEFVHGLTLGTYHSELSKVTRKQ